MKRLKESWQAIHGMIESGITNMFYLVSLSSVFNEHIKYF